MTKLYKIQFIKETELHKVGDLGNANKKNAEAYINNGYAVYVKEKPSDKKVKEKPKKLTKRAIRELCQEAGINTDLKTFIFDEKEIIQQRVFTSHLLNKEVFGFGILLPRTEDLLGKNGNVVGTCQKWRAVDITSEHRGLVVSQWFQTEYKISFEGTPYEMRLRWELKDIDDFLHNEKQTKIDGKALFDSIKKQYEHYLFFRSKEWYSVNSLWDMGTYVHQLFSAYPLKENRGLSGTAKTKTMLVSSYMTLNATDIMTNPSESTLFRETELLRPTKYVDEAEKLFKFTKEGMEADNRVELLNASYIRNGSVPRQEKIDGQYVTKWYHVYSPTQISSINGLYGATETRAISQTHTKAPDTDIRGENDPEDDIEDIKWKKIRNSLYRWALENCKDIYSSYLNFDIATNLKKRDLQIWKPLLVLAKIIDEKELLPQIISFAEKLSEQRKNDNLSEGSLDYKYLTCLNDLLLSRTSDKTDKIYVEDIRIKYNNSYGTLDEKKSNKSISTHLDKLGFKELRNKDRRGAYYDLTKNIFDEIITPLTRDFMVESDKDKEQEEENKKKSSQSSQSSQSREKQQEICDEQVTNSDEFNDKDKKKCDECDESDENDESPEQDTSEIEKIKINFTEDNLHESS